MKAIRLGLLLTLAVGLGASSSPTDPPRLPPGTRGYGLTVFQGTRIERFPVTILGRAEKALGGYDMILCRVDGGMLSQKGLGIVAGMSGSPVFVDGRMIGAIGYGWAFSKEPIGGICPLEAMQHNLPRPMPQGSSNLSPPLLLGGRRFQTLRVAAPGDHPPGQGLTMSPIDTMLQIDGISGRAFDFLQQELRPLGFEVAVGTPGGRSSAPMPPMLPGSAVGVELMTGDFQAAATGTLTWRSGDRILAFGHPMGMLGEDLHLPLTAAYINTVLPSIQRPFKLAAQIGPVGEMRSDGTWAIGGTLGPVAPMVPLTLHVRTDAAGRSYRVRLAQHEQFISSMAASAAMQAISAHAAGHADYTGKLTYRIKPKGFPVVELHDMAAGHDVDQLLASEFGGRVSELVHNPFRPLEIESIEALVDLTRGRRGATLDKLETDRPEYRAGDTVHLTVRLRPYGSRTSEAIPLEFPLPSDLPKGALQVAAFGGEMTSSLRTQLGLVDHAAEDLDTLVGRTEQRRGHQQLSVALVLPDQRITVAGESFPSLPAGARDWLAQASSSAFKPEKDAVFLRRNTDYALRGEPTLSLKIADPLPKPKAIEIPGTQASASPSASPSPGNPAHLLPFGGQRWDVSTPEQLRRGTFQGSRLDAEGGVAPGPAAEPLADFAALPWTLARTASGQVLTGTVGPGLIYRDRTLWAHTGQGAVLSLATQPGRVWAGTGPNGVVAAYGDDGRLLFKVPLPVSYVWALQPHEGGVLAACGLPGNLYQISADGRATLLWHSSEQHLRSLLTTSQGLLIGTASRGTIYRQIPGGLPQALFTLPEASVDALVQAGGQMLAATPGALYRFALGSPWETIPLESPAASLTADSSGAVWVGTGKQGVLYRLPPGERSPQSLPLGAESVTALLEAGGGMVAATGLPNRLVQLGQATPVPAYLSEVYDAGLGSRWGSLRWLGQGVSAQTRSGPTPSPDDSWSPWSPPLSRAEGEPISSPAARYLQVRFSLGRLASFSVSSTALPAAPLVQWVSPRGGERWTGSQTVRFRLTDGDFTALRYVVQAQSGNVTRAVAEITATHPAGSEESCTWDTHGVSDGTWQLRLEALPRAGGAALLQTTSAAVQVSNTPPQLSVSSRTPSLHGVALGSHFAIVEVFYKIGEGSWLAAHPDDGLFDSPREAFTIDAPEGSAMEIRAVDEAGQQASLHL